MTAAARAADVPAPIEVEGNQLTLITEGPDRLRALLDLIGGAECSLKLVFYIFADDRSGRAVRDALVAARARGVEVALLVDGFGSSDADDAFFAPLRDGGAAFCRYEPTKGRRYLIRNHQKFAIADERVALTGGFNVEDGYFGAAPRDPDAWRDLGLLIEGPAAARLAQYFDALHGWTQGRRAKARGLNEILEAHSEQDGSLRWLMGGPTRFLSAWAQAAKLDMARASRLCLVAAYFGPGRTFLRIIGGAARRGAARVITAANSDNTATIAAARHTYRTLLGFGVRIFEYRAAKLHTKLLVIDDVVYVGSANFDRRSIFLNCEIMVRVKDARFAAQALAYVDGECARSREITREYYEKRRSVGNVVRWTLSHWLVSVLDYNVSRRLNLGIEE